MYKPVPKTNLSTKSYKNELDLLDRSRAERNLDSIFVKQTKQISKNKRLGEEYVAKTSSDILKRLFTTDKENATLKRLKTQQIHEYEIKLNKKNVSSSESKNKSRNNSDNDESTSSALHKGKVSDKNDIESSSSKKCVVEALYEIGLKHLKDNVKFNKSVNLFRKMWISYFSDETKSGFFFLLFKVVTADLCVLTHDNRLAVTQLFEECVLPVLESYEKNWVNVGHVDDNISEIKQNIINTNNPRKNVNCSEDKICEIRHFERKNFDQKKDENIGTKNKLNELNNSTKNMSTLPSLTLSEYRILKALSFRGFYHSKLFTDDSFVFNKSIAYLKNEFNQFHAEIIGDISSVVESHNESSRDSESGSCNGANEEKDAYNVDCDVDEAMVELGDKQVPKLNGDERCVVSSGNDIFLPKEEIQSCLKKFFYLSLEQILSELTRFKLFFFYDVLKTLFTFKNFLWARNSVENFFQMAYIKRDIFTDVEKTQIEYWQTELKCKIRQGKAADVYAIDEAKNIVRDGREEKIVTLHGSFVWSTKQTGV